jgi:microcystin degradation protein MlrC
VDLLWQAHQEKPLDAIALNLHGAGVADGYPDADGEIIRAVREKFGSDMPIGVVLDLHANVTDEMLRLSDLLLGVKCYPHVDEFESGRLMFGKLVDMVQKKEMPAMAMVRLPWLLVPAEGVTTEGPAHQVQQLCYRLPKENKDLFDVTFFHGFPYSDIPEACVCVTAVAATQEAADAAAMEVARFAWSIRKEFSVPVYSPEEAFDLALQLPEGNGPIVINESSDNTGGGAPGDGTHLLREMLRRNIPGSAMGYIYDPEVAQQAARAGVGATISCRLGGKTDPLHGEPLVLEAYVKTISDGTFINHSPMGGGNTSRIGLCACLVVGNVSIVVGSIRTQPMDDGVFRIAGLRWDLLRIVGIKSSQHFKGWWAQRAGGIVACDPPGVHCANLRCFRFKNTNTEAYPLEDIIWKAWNTENGCACHEGN